MQLSDFKYNLRNLKKCDQAWSDLKPIEGGRYCDACSKTIVDFSAMTVEEIAVFMAESTEKVCGFYRPEQLSPPGILRKTFPLALGMTSLFLQSAKAQNEIPRISTTQYAAPPTLSSVREEQSQIDSTQKNITLKVAGRLVELNENNTYSPVCCAAVLFKGTQIGTASDENGYFSLTYTTTGPLPLSIVIASVGHNSKSIEFNSVRNSIDLNEIVLDKASMIEFTVMFKKRSKLSRFWKKITHPFRQK